MSSITLPTIKIPSVEEQADELLNMYGGVQADAVAAAARIEVDASWRKAADFLITQVPLVGGGTILLRDLWRNIRRCALVARLYGHDTQSAETQAMILACLMPVAGGGGANGGDGTTPASEDVDGIAVAMRNNSSRLVAVSVSKALATETFMRTTGLKSLWLAVRLVEAASGLVRLAGSPVGGDKGTDLQVTRGSSGMDIGDKASSTHEKDAHQVHQQAMPDLMQPHDQEQQLQPLQQPQDDAEQTSPVKVALVLFRPPSVDERPSALAGMVFLWLLPILVSAGRFIGARMVPLLRRRVKLELPLVAVVGALLLAQAPGLALFLWVRRRRDILFRSPVTTVFVIYCAIPGITIFLSTRTILQGFSEAPYFVLLGVFNFGSGFLRWTEDLRDDAALDKRKGPLVVSVQPQVRRARQALWVLLLLDFVLEEVLGRVLGLHSWHLLGSWDDRLSLVEYRTAAFAMGLVGAWAQTRVLELLQRRSVLLRLLGARQAILAGYTLLLMGATALTREYSGTLQFLRDSSPSPRMCCNILWIRQFGACLGAAVPIIMFALMPPSPVGRLPSETLVPIALAAGALLSHLCCWSLNSIWYERLEHLESDYRVLYLLPHNTARGRRLASNALKLAQKRVTEATTRPAVEWAAREVVRMAANRFVRIR